MSTLKQYYLLTKPGIIRGNALAAIAGYFLASKTTGYDWGAFAAMLAGISLVIGSGCVFNNYLDRGIDKKMERTKQRALVNGDISVQHALLFGGVLGIVGAGILGVYTNLLTMAIAIVGFIFYVVIYGIGKRATVHGTLIGSISGAIPPVVGYTALSNDLDTAALLLFIIMTTWQMPHFYAIAMYRLKDYKAAGIPVLPAVSGMRATKIQILGYIVAFIIASLSLTILGYTGLVYAAIMATIGFIWLARGIAGFKATDDIVWAKQMFGFSLLALLAFCGSLIIDALLV